MTYADSDLDRALLGQPSKKVEATRSHEWNARVARIIADSQRRGSFYLVLGYAVYGGGSAVILAFLWHTPAIATALIMFLFQVCVMYFGTKVMFPRFDGMFWITIEGNRDSVPAFEKIARTAEDTDIKAFVKEGRAAFADMSRAAASSSETLVSMKAHLSEIRDGIKKFNEPDPVDYSLLEGEKR